MTRLCLDGRIVVVPGQGGTLLDALRDHAGVLSVKDGCSPQGQCGCCTVLVDGVARAACVTPLRRVAGRSITTVDGLDAKVSGGLVDAFTAHGASQCGFCTPGILVRLASLGPGPTVARVESALLAHVCRCTGWQTILEALRAGAHGGDHTSGVAGADSRHVAKSARNLSAASRRASLEGGAFQIVGREATLGRAGFAADTAPPGRLVAVPDNEGGWRLADSLGAARAAVAKVQGRRSGQTIDHSIEVPPGEWALTLRTAWVEPAYLEPDASWCVPGGEPVSAVANGGAFGAKSPSVASEAARRLAAEHQRPVLVVLSREDVVRLGAKRPPIAAGVNSDGTGHLRVATTPGIVEAVHSAAPGLTVEEVDIVGPATSAAIRGAGWAEAAILLAALRAPLRGSASDAANAADGSGWAEITSAEGATASASVDVDGDGAPTAVDVAVRCGRVLDEVVLRSYCIGAAHMALGWVCSEGIALDPEGVPSDLTMRSFGLFRARDTPPIRISITDDDGDEAEVRGSDAVFAAVAAATWIAQGLPRSWPTRRRRFL